jgi:dolichyl-phosphate-mannose--protein O-mannosyl transferase
MKPSGDQVQIRYAYGLLLLLCAVVVIGARLSQPEMMYFDEVYFVPSARDMLAGLALGEVTHPPLGKLLISLSIYLFGDTPFAWRLPSCLSGIALVGILYRLMMAFGSSRTSATLCSLIVVCDGLCVTQARVGILNAPSVAFGFGALLCAVRVRSLWAGLLLGCSIACKFIGLAFAPLVLFVLMSSPLKKGSDPGRRVSNRLVLSLLATLVAYLLAFVPLRRFMSSFLSGVWLYHRTMFEHHLVEATLPHRYQSSWWTWPLSLRPIWYGFEEIPGTDLIRGVLCMASPVTSLLVLLGVIAILLRLIVERKFSWGERVAFGGFVLQFLPWAFSPRLTMYHYYYPALVFGMVLACLQMERLKESVRTPIMLVTVLATVVMFIYWYPLWSALPIPRSLYESRIWFDSWV